MSKDIRVVNEPDVFRKNIVDKLYSIIKNKNISENLEKGIFNYTIQKSEEKNLIKKWNNTLFVLIYIEKLKMIVHNIKDKKLYNKLINKEIKAHELAFLSHEEMRPDIWKELIELKKN